MSSVQTVKVHLTGAYKGRTIDLGSLPYRFIDGVCNMTGSATELALACQFLERNWSAYPEGDARLETPAEGNDVNTSTDLFNPKGEDNGKRHISQVIQSDPDAGLLSDLQRNGGGSETRDSTDLGSGSTETETGNEGLLSDGNGRAPGVDVNEKLIRAIGNLDPANNDHWTKDGRPAVTAVSTFYGAGDVTRKDIEDAAPNVRRPNTGAA